MQFRLFQKGIFKTGLRLAYNLPKIIPFRKMIFQRKKNFILQTVNKYWLRLVFMRSVKSLREVNVANTEKTLGTLDQELSDY